MRRSALSILMTRAVTSWSDLEHVLDLVDALFADLGDVDEAIDVVLQANERAEAGELGDLAGDEVADLVILVDVRPRIFGELFDADGDALVGLVDFQHDRFDFVALLQHFGRMIDLARPGNVRDVDHAIQAFFQFDESAVAGEVANLAFDVVPGGYFSSALSHGLVSSWRMPSEIFCSSRLMPSTTASISWSA